MILLFRGSGVRVLLQSVLGFGFGVWVESVLGNSDSVVHSMP